MKVISVRNESGKRAVARCSCPGLSFILPLYRGTRRILVAERTLEDLAFTYPEHEPLDECPIRFHLDGDPKR
jgi:hypothetical protein